MAGVSAMAKARPGYLSLNGGEIDEELLARADVESYVSRASVLENALPRVRGGIAKAPGTRHIAEFANQSIRLYPFSFSVDQSFMLVFQPERLTIVQNDGLVEGGTIAAQPGSWGAASPQTQTLPPPLPPVPGGVTFPRSFPVDAGVPRIQSSEDRV